MCRTCWKGEEIEEATWAFPLPLPCLRVSLGSCLACFWNFRCLHHLQNNFILLRTIAYRPFGVIDCKVLFSVEWEFFSIFICLFYLYIYTHTNFEFAYSFIISLRLDRAFSNFGEFQKNLIARIKFSSILKFLFKEGCYLYYPLISTLTYKVGKKFMKEKEEMKKQGGEERDRERCQKMSIGSMYK